MKAIVGWTSCAQIGLLALLWQNGGEAVLADDVAKLPPAAWLVLPLTNSEVQYPPSSVWGPASTDPKYNMLHAGDRLRTLEDGRATIRLGENSLVHLDQLTLVQIIPPRTSSSKCRFNLAQGLMYLLHRDEPSGLEVQTLAVNAAVEGTDFAIAVDADGATTIALIDGRVQMSNSQGTVTIESGEEGAARPGQRPTKTALIDAVNSVQWSLYYPGVLDPDELGLDASSPFASSLAAYRRGGLVPAFALCPKTINSTNASERLYRAALLLSAGEVTHCEAILQSEQDNPMTMALRYVIAAVKFERISGATTGSSPSQCLGFSYYAQSQHDLEGALKAAQQAVSLSTNFGFAWERVAELQFSFGRIAAAEEALNRCLRLAPDNAQAHALRGFLLAADNRIREAIAEFDLAIQLDANLGNAWLGRGLCRIKRRETRAGFQDLLTAAMLEPNRSVLHSYLGKAFANAGEDRRARDELRLARRWDERDPTAWLYSALLEQQENQINPAISDLETAETNNDNRSVFRSRLLLDQDRAVASANLASIYRDAGMTDVSVREAARAVTDDYANDSAHLFLADSYYDLLDPTQFNLRYDTVWFNELLLANILAPVGAGRLSQQVSQQDYSKLFEADGLGLASASDARTDGMFHQTASQFGTYGNTSYGFDLDYHHNNGVRINNTLDNVNLDATIKQQVGPQDTAMLLAQYENYHSGDNFQYYYQTNARPFYNFAEQQQPELVGTWHHEWAPGIHTLLLLDRLVDNQQFSDKAAPQLLFFQPPQGGPPYLASSVPFDVSYQEEIQVYGAELNQICQWEHVTLVAGGRYQSGEFQTQDQLSNPSKYSFYFTQPSGANTTGLFQRVSGYSYLTVEPLDHLWLTGGAAADDEKFPYYFRNPPVTSGEDSRSQLGPKAALVWNPIPEATVRGIYTRSLGGVSIDESYRLEPTELAGFPQAFRSLISESVVGSQSAPTFETLGGAVDLKLGTRTYLGFQLERLRSGVNQGIGDFLVPDGGIHAITSSTPEQFDYKEHVGSVTLNQLIGADFVLGAAYKITQSDLHETLHGIPVSALASANQMLTATLQEIDTYLLFNHPSGFYAKFEAHWYGQNNAGWTPAEPDVNFAQENIFAGYRFAHRRAELQLGVLNLSGGGYDLNPLTVYQELPRKRVFEAGLNFVF
ncbi:MAG: FecR domain-containing protein [Verrucomicrobiota bacterium]